MANKKNTNQTVSPDALSDKAKEELKETIQGLADSFLRVSAERDVQKQLLDDMFDELGVDKRLVRRMAKVYHKGNYSEEVDNEETFQEFYEQVVKKQ